MKSLASSTVMSTPALPTSRAMALAPLPYSSDFVTVPALYPVLLQLVVPLIRCSPDYLLTRLVPRVSRPRAKVIVPFGDHFVVVAPD